MIKKSFIFGLIFFAAAFLLGVSLSPDNSLSLWPAIPTLESEEEVEIVCALGPAVDKDGKTKADYCVCQVVPK